MISFLIAALALAAGGVFYYAIHGYVIAGYSAYERRSMVQLSSGLADNFLFMEPRLIYMGTGVAMLTIGIIAFTSVGGIGALLIVVTVGVIPIGVLRYLKTKRTESFVYQLPDCLSTISMSLRAGSNFGRALSMVVEQQPAPISQEFALVISEVRMGRQVEDALQSLYRRINSAEVELFISAVAISRSVGGNLADTLENLSDTIRERMQIEGKIQALTAMGRMQGWVVGAMPLLVAYVLYKREPESVSAFVNEPIGWLISSILVIMAALAAYMIYKIVNIDV